MVSASRPMINTCGALCQMLGFDARWTLSRNKLQCYANTGKIAKLAHFSKRYGCFEVKGLASLRCPHRTQTDCQSENSLGLQRCLTKKNSTRVCGGGDRFLPRNHLNLKSDVSLHAPCSYAHKCKPNKLQCYANTGKIAKLAHFSKRYGCFEVKGLASLRCPHRTHLGRLTPSCPSVS